MAIGIRWNRWNCINLPRLAVLVLGILREIREPAGHHFGAISLVCELIFAKFSCRGEFQIAQQSKPFPLSRPNYFDVGHAYLPRNPKVRSTHGRNSRHSPQDQRIFRRSEHHWPKISCGAPLLHHAQTSLMSFYLLLFGGATSGSEVTDSPRARLSDSESSVQSGFGCGSLIRRHMASPQYVFPSYIDEQRSAWPVHRSNLLNISGLNCSAT